MDQFTKHMQTLFNGQKTAVPRRGLQGGCRKKWPPLTPPATLPILLKLVDGCQNSELR